MCNGYCCVDEGIPSIERVTSVNMTNLLFECLEDILQEVEARDGNGPC